MITEIEIRITFFMDEGNETELSERVPTEFLRHKPEELERVCAELITEAKKELAITG